MQIRKEQTSTLLALFLSVLSAFSWSNDNQSDNTEDKEPELRRSSAERAVMPFTNWVEDKIQDSSLLKPSPYSKDKIKLKGKDLRTAIKYATKMYPGTVLSAKRIESDQGEQFFVKIISSEGLIKTIHVPSSDGNHKESSKNENTTD